MSWLWSMSMKENRVYTNEERKERWKLKRQTGLGLEKS